MNQKSTVWLGTDGCKKRYLCALSIYLISALSDNNKIILYCYTGAPVHVNDVIDGLNNRHKYYSKKYGMCGSIKKIMFQILVCFTVP